MQFKLRVLNYSHGSRCVQYVLSMMRKCMVEVGESQKPIKDENKGKKGFTNLTDIGEYAMCIISLGGNWGIDAHAYIGLLLIPR